MYKNYNKYGQFGKDYEEGVNFQRLRSERLKKTREAMERHGLGAMVAFAGENIRYITGIMGLPFPGERYTVLPIGGEPIQFELGGDLRWVRDFGAPWMAGRVNYSIPIGDRHCFGHEGAAKSLELWVEGIKKVLKDCGVVHEKVGFDYLAGLAGVLEDANIKYVDAWPCMYDARYIKTRDELQLLAIASTIADAGFHTMEQMIKPGVRECDVWAEMVKTMLSLGAEEVMGTFASGGRTNPYCRFVITDKILGPGDLIISDIVLQYMGYRTCVVRTMLVGDKPTSEQKALYREAYDSLLKTMNACKAGVGTDQVAKALPEGTWEDFSLNIAHGVGVSVHEPPFVTHMLSEKYPTELKLNAYMAVETYAGEPGGGHGVRLEQDFVITETGYETFSRYPFDERML
jgi:Xaa-Pro aminopeptidase